jgi:large subunit ribosomal protein LP0
VLLDNIKLNVGLVFCDGDMGEIAEIIEETKIGADAKAGSIAPVDVFVPAGPTGLDPSMTSFFQALGIGTKIVKGQIEIITEQQLIKEGKKVGSSESVLCQKLNIKPFSYNLRPISIYDNGNLYSPKVLKLSQDEILEKFLAGVRNIAALSLSMGVPTTASVPHSIANGFKNLVALALGADYTFDQAA